MKYVILVILSLISYSQLQAQTYELGGYLGGSNFIGDVGATNFIAPKNIAIGGVFKWNRSPRHSFRFSLIYTQLEGKDKDSDDPRREERNYSFKAPILEASLGLEFTFFNFNLHSRKTNATPYLFAGFSFAKHDNFHFSAAGEKVNDNTSSYIYGIPMAIGYKAQVLESLILAIEIGARYTFTDEIDGSVPDDKDLQHLAFGNINNNDWYMLTGITLTYTFGETPCYCAF